MNEVTFKPTNKEPISQQSNNFEKNFDNTMKKNDIKLNEVNNMLTEKEQSLKKKIFKLDKTESLVFSDPKLSAVYNEMAENGEEKYGYHYNETIMNIIFNEYVLNSPKYIQKYKMAIPKEKKRRDKSGINQLKQKGEKKINKELNKDENLEETTSAGSAGGAAGYVGYAGPAAWSKNGKTMKRPIMHGVTFIGESNYLTDPQEFEKYVNFLNEETEIDYIQKNSEAYGSLNNMNKNDLDIIQNDIKTKKIEEEAKSKAQQRFMGIVRAVQTGEISPDKVSEKIRKAANTMKKKDVMDFASTKHEDLPEKVDEGVLAMEDIYNDEINAGKNEYDAARTVLDTLTNGAWSSWGENKIKIFLNKIVKYMKNLNKNLSSVNEDGESIIDDSSSSMAFTPNPVDQSSGVPRGMMDAGLTENEIKTTLNNLDEELETYSIYHKKLKKMTEDRKPSSLVMKDRLGTENTKNFKSDMKNSGTGEIINIEKELQWKEQQTDVGKNPQKLGADLEKNSLKTTKGESFKNVGNSTNDKGDEIPKRNLTDDEMSEVEKYRLGLGDFIFDNKPDERFEERMKADMGEKLYDQRIKKMEFRAEAPMYNKDTQPIENGMEKDQFNKEKSGWNERDGIKESALIGKYDVHGKNNFINFKLKNVINGVNEDQMKDYYVLNLKGLGNTLNSKGELNEEIRNIVLKYDFYTDGDNVLAVKSTKKLIESHNTNKENIDTSFNKMKHLLDYDPTNYLNTKTIKENRGF